MQRDTVGYLSAGVIFQPYLVIQSGDPQTAEQEWPSRKGSSQKKKTARGSSSKLSKKRDRDLEINSLSNDEKRFVKQFEANEEHENAILVLALAYSRYGRGPFPMSLLRKLSALADLSVPDRIDMTLKQARHNGKPIIHRMASGNWKITPSGEKRLREIYSIKRGKTPPPQD